jgi:hypothetical protein
MSVQTQRPTAITHKEKGRFWEDYKHDWPVSSLPRNPEFFEPAPAATETVRPHFLVKMRKLPGDKQNRSEIVRNCIENGYVYPAEEDNRYRFLWNNPDDGELYSLIVHLRAGAFASESMNHYAITVYQVEQ